MPEFARQMLDFKRVYGIKHKSFRLVRATALQFALQVYSKIVVGSGNAFDLHLYSSCITSVSAFHVIIYFMHLLHLITW